MAAYERYRLGQGIQARGRHQREGFIVPCIGRSQNTLFATLPLSQTNSLLLLLLELIAHRVEV